MGCEAISTGHSALPLVGTLDGSVGKLGYAFNISVIENSQDAIVWQPGLCSTGLETQYMPNAVV